MSLEAQNNPLEKYQWKSRILITLDSNKKSELYTQQIKLLGKLDEAFSERKLLVFYVEENGYTILNGKDPSFIANSSLYNDFNTKTSGFKIALVGLDGGIKLKQTTPITRSELFSIIDGMPMRKAELRHKN